MALAVDVGQLEVRQDLAARTAELIARVGSDERDGFNPMARAAYAASWSW